MNFSKIYALGLRHLYLIMNSFQSTWSYLLAYSSNFLWGFISKFFTLNSEYYSNTVGVILTAAILYDFLFRASISFNMMFLEEIWSRNFTNLFIAPIKIREIIAALTLTAIVRTSIGLVPGINCHSIIWCICTQTWNTAYFLINFFVLIWDYFSLLLLQDCWYGHHLKILLEQVYFLAPLDYLLSNWNITYITSNNC